MKTSIPVTYQKSVVEYAPKLADGGVLRDPSGTLRLYPYFDEQYLCQSYFNDNNQLIDCTCGRCA